MKVCVLTHVYPRFKNDPMPPFIEFTSESIQKLGVDVTVLTPYHPQFARTQADHTVDLKTYKYVFPSNWHLLGYSNTLIHDCQLKKIVYFLAPLMFLSSMIHLFLLHRKQQFNLLHAHWLLPNGFIAAVISKLCKIPLVISFHGSDVFVSKKNLLFKSMAKWALKQAGKITSSSPEFKQYLEETEINTQKFHVIPYGVEPGLFDKVPVQSVVDLKKKLRIQKDELILFALGRIVWKKGFDYLIRTVPKVLEQVPNLKIIIGGDGSHLNALKQLVCSLGLDNVVHFPGAIYRNEIPTYFYLCDVFVMPAIHDPKGNVDGCPNVVLEAMASGKPVVASNISGIPLVVSHEENGLLVEEKNIDELAGAVLKLLASKKLRDEFGQASKEKVRRFLIWSKIAQQFLTVCQECCTANTQKNLLMKRK